MFHTKRVSLRSDLCQNRPPVVRTVPSTDQLLDRLAKTGSMYHQPVYRHASLSHTGYHAKPVSTPAASSNASAPAPVTQSIPVSVDGDEFVSDIHAQLDRLSRKPHPIAAPIELTCGSLKASVLQQGATLASLHVPDRAGVLGDILLGFSQPAPATCFHLRDGTRRTHFAAVTNRAWEQQSNPFFNCVVGRTSGRIGPDPSTGTVGFSLDGVHFPLPGCDGQVDGLKASTHLHGGPTGFNRCAAYTCTAAARLTGAHSS